jgi:hypothetical protein
MSIDLAQLALCIRAGECEEEIGKIELGALLAREREFEAPDRLIGESGPRIRLNAIGLVAAFRVIAGLVPLCPLRLLTRPWHIVERGHRTMDERPLNATLDGLMVHSHSPRHRNKRQVFPVGQQHPRPRDPARRFRLRTGNRAQCCQILLTNCQFDRMPPPCHDLNPLFQIKPQGYRYSCRARARRPPRRRYRVSP